VRQIILLSSTGLQLLARAAADHLGNMLRFAQDQMSVAP